MSVAVAFPRSGPEGQTHVLHAPAQISKQKILRSSSERKDGTIYARGCDGKRREVVPFVSNQGQAFGWAAQEDESNPSLHTAYPIENPNTRAGRIIIRAIARRIALQQMEVGANYQQWPESPVRRAVVLGYGLRFGHSSDHETFDINSIAQYRELAPEPPVRRRSRRIAAMQERDVPAPMAASGYSG